MELLIKMKVVLYPRVSSKKQLKGESIDAQVSRLKKFCEDNNYEVVDIYSEEGKSASLKEDTTNLMANTKKFSIEFDLNQRPALKRIINDADAGKFSGIVFYKWDRWSRSVIFAKICKMYFDSKNIELIPSDDSRDPLASSIMQILGEEEIRKMKARVRETRILRFQKGMMTGRSPFGYMTIVRDKKVVGFKPKTKEAEVVKDIFKMASEGIDYKEICSKHKIKPQQYYNIIKNKVYCGIVSFEGQEKQGIHEPLISKELFDSLQKR
jgi:site-specific DNA recombinase